MTDDHLLFFCDAGAGAASVKNLGRPDHAGVFWDVDGRGIVCVQVFVDEETRLLLIDAEGIGEPYLIDELPLWWAPDYWPQWRRER